MGKRKETPPYRSSCKTVAREEKRNKNLAIYFFRTRTVKTTINKHKQLSQNREKKLTLLLRNFVSLHYYYYYYYYYILIQEGQN